MISSPSMPVEDSTNIYWPLRAPEQTPSDEICSCPSGTPVKLMSTGRLGFNPIHCLECNLEVPPERLGLGRDLTQAIAYWLSVYGAIDALELASGEYEEWARGELLNPESPPNREGLAVAREVNELNRCYFWFWQPESDDDWQPRTTCPVCGEALVPHDSGIFPQLLCEADSVVLVGG